MLFNIGVAVVKGWTVILPPIILSLGAAFGAFNFDIDHIDEPLVWKNWKDNSPWSKKKINKEET